MRVPMPVLELAQGRRGRVEQTGGSGVRTIRSGDEARGVHGRATAEPSAVGTPNLFGRIVASSSDRMASNSASAESMPRSIRAKV